ncbi:MAG: hypothetical protein JEY94_00750 [Melioribacteraceae bacterium]|nr:hypothetical protein [Melioribacteraceae bacterium]
MRLITFLLLILTIVNYGQIENKWLTKFEKSVYKATFSYDETMEYFGKLADHSENADMIEFGISPQGRKLYCFIAASNNEFTPEKAKKSGKPIIFINNGIHSGEIEGKDACALLLRQILITKEKKEYLDDVILMVIPIHNVDGHERKSKYNRINQNGPEEMGWRTTAQNLNLNRDFLKADALEMQSWLKLFGEWLPDLLIDVHTTNGANYQYTITYSMETYKNIPDKTAKWVKNEFLPIITKETEDAGYLTAPYLWFRDGIIDGFTGWVAGPRFSNGYAAAQNRPGLLIETHMLKSYKDRVYGTKAMLESVIKYYNTNANEIVLMNKEADEFVVSKYALRKEYFPIKFANTKKFENFKFKGFKSISEYSMISGSEVVKYTDKKCEVDIPFYNDFFVKDSVKLPDAYLIPSEWSDLVRVLKYHGVEVEILDSDEEFEVEEYKFNDVKFSTLPYEGRFQPGFKFEIDNKKAVLPKGTFRVKTAQRNLPVIAHLLEPIADDSFVRWGFMNQIFERKEYFEMYSMEPIANEMFQSDEALREEFLRKIDSDEKFKNDPRARINFFYEKSEYYDKKHNVYPVLRQIK